MSKFLNEIQVESAENISEKLIRYLLSIRETSNLMIMATDVPEMDWAKSFYDLKVAFKAKIDKLSGHDQNELSNFTSIIRYVDRKAKCTRGLSITFGKSLSATKYDSSFTYDVEEYINNLPVRALNQYYTLPIVRIALMVHSLRSSLDGSEQLKPMKLDEFAILDFNSQDWRYAVADSTQQFELKVLSNNQEKNRFHLRVSRPHTQLFGNNLSERWVFDNKATGLSFFNLSLGPKLKFKDSSQSKPTYMMTQKMPSRSAEGAEKEAKENLKKQTAVIANHEAYWNAILFDLLDAAQITYHRRAFSVDQELFVQPEFKGRGLELTNDYLGTESANIISDNIYTIRYFLQPECLFQVEDEDQDKSIDLVEHLSVIINQVNVVHDKASIKTNIEWVRVTNQADANLVFGQYTPDKSWRVAASPTLDSTDLYGQEKILDLVSGRLNTKQFMTLDPKLSKPKLERAISECYLKEWASQSSFSKRITATNLDEYGAHSKFIALTMRRVKQKGATKAYNVFHACYEFEQANGQLIFNKPNVYAELGVVLRKDEEPLKLLDYYDSFIEGKLPVLNTLYDVLDDSNDGQLIENAIGKRFYDSDSVLIFEHDGESVQSVWQSTSKDLWLPPVLDEYLEGLESMQDFIKLAIADEAYSKSDNTGKITQDKRKAKESHYDVMIDGCSVLIHRKHYNQNAKMVRHLIKNFDRLYPAEPIKSVSEAYPVMSSLLSPEASAYKDSGVKESIHEKIFGLFLD